MSGISAVSEGLEVKMARYNTGDVVVFRTSKEKAYEFNLLDNNKLSAEELDVFRRTRWGDSDYWDALVRLDVPMRFYGKVTEIRGGMYADNKPYKEVICLLFNAEFFCEFDLKPVA